MPASNLPLRCGYCGYAIVEQTERAWRRTPHGRPYCPRCKAIPADWQGKPRQGHARYSVTVEASDA